MCTQAGRLDEALDLVKRLARQHGAMQQATLNSLTRALSASHVDRALRLLSLMNTLGLRATRCCLCCPTQVRLRVARLAQAVCQVSFVPILCTALPFKPWNGRIDPIFSATLGIVQAQRGSPVAAMCRETCVTLIWACAKASRSDVAEAMYWDLRRQKLEVTRSAGSALIVSLCAADATARAQTVYDDMMLVAAGDKSSSPVRACTSP